MLNLTILLLAALLFSGEDHPPCSEFEIPHYNAYRATTMPQIDGRLDEPIWQVAPRSAPFRDLIAGTKTIHDTRVAVLWDDEYLICSLLG